MIDSVGNVGSVLLVGGTSEIGLAVLTRMTGPRLSRVELAGRPSTTLDRAGDLIRNSGVPNVAVHAFDATDRAAQGPLVDSVFDAGDIDVAIMAVGAAGDAARGPARDAASELDPAAMARVIDTNLTGVAGCATHIARRMRAQGHGTIVIFAAAAVEKPNAANVSFEASQAGLDAFALGLGESLQDSGARVLLVRLGRVLTKLGAELDAGPVAGSTPGARRGMPRPKRSARPVAHTADVANAVAAAVRSKRATVVYVPASVRAAATRARLFSRGR